MCAGTPPSRSKDALARKNTDHEAADELHLNKKKDYDGATDERKLKNKK